ncbi:MAG: helix-turn-helix domain-containing protein [Pseudomonadota bacterium]
MGQEISIDKTVKSVRRVFEIFELFERERRAMSAKEVATALNYPLTSTHALLKSIHDLGYADYDAERWTYVPSPALSMVSEWSRDFLSREASIVDLAGQLNNETRETINLSRRINLRIRIIYGLESQQSVGVSVRIGTMMPLYQTHTGIVALSAMDDSERAASLERLAENDPEQFASVDQSLIEATHTELTERGSAMGCDRFMQGIGAICTPIVTSDRAEPLVLGIVGPSDRIAARGDEHRKVLKRLVAEHKVKTLFRLR